MNPTPLNIQVLQSNSFLRLDENRKFLVSQAGTTLRKWDLLPGKPGNVGNISLIKKITLGSVTVSFTPNWVAVASGSSGYWGINTARFAGTPKLKIETKHHTTQIILTLSGARFPGLDVPADFTARIFMENGVEQMDLQFAFCGFSAQVNLVDWLNGKTPATGQVFLDDQLCRLTEGVKLTAAGCPYALFHPSWLFVFGDIKTPFVTLTSQGHTTRAHMLALALLGPGMPSVIPNPADRRSALFIPEDKGFDLPLWPEKTEGWQFIRNPLAPPFRWLGIETDERLSDGRIRRAIVAVGSPNDFIFFRPGADLLNDAMVPFFIPLHLPIYSAIYLGDGTRLGAALIALRGDQPLTLHTERCSLALGPMPRKPRFFLFQNDVSDTFYLGPLPDSNAKLHPGLQFTLIATAPRLGDGLVVDPLPPLVPSLMTLTLAPLARPLLHIEGEIAVTAGDPHARIRLPEWSWTQVVRPRDLLVLGFQFLGLRPEFHGSGPGQLLNSPLPDAPRVVVYLPPQNITEMTAFEDEVTKIEQVPDPYLQKIPAPAPHRSAGLSRLVFDLPVDAAGIPYTIEQLLDWSGSTLRPRLDSRALSPFIVPDLPGHGLYSSPKALVKVQLAHGLFMPTDPAAGTSSTPNPPALDTTAIEAPYRLFISPDQYGYWDTAISTAMAKSPRAALWHAHLMTKASPATPVIRALYAVDDFPGFENAPLENAPYAKTQAERNYPPTSLKKADRQNLVRNSVLKPVDAKRLMLSSLGAWLDLDGSWAEFPEASLIKWEHRATLGRDQFVKVVRRGFGFPFGHRLIEIKISERKFGQFPTGRVGAWMRQRIFYVVIQPELTYFDTIDNATPANPAQSKEMPFRRVRILTRVTPLIDRDSDPIEPSTSLPAGTPKARWLEVLEKDFLFNFVAEDREGNLIEFSAPMAFVPHDNADPEITIPVQYSGAIVLSNAQGAITDQAGSAKETRRRYQFQGQSIAYTEGDSGKSALETESIVFSATLNNAWTPDSVPPPFFPKITTAQVTIAALRSFAANADLQTIRYAQPYLTHGYSGDYNKGQIFAQIDNGSKIEYGDSNPADKVGGLVTPAMTAGGLSRTHGVVGADPLGAAPIEDALAKFAGGIFNPKDYFGNLSAKLLGGINLTDILFPDLPFANGDTTTPRWTTHRDGGDIVNSLLWETTHLVTSSFFRAEAGAKLILENQIRVNANDSGQTTAISSATLKNFALDLLDLIIIPFEEFSMTTEAGRKPEVNVLLKPIEFTGALKFLSEIQDKLHLDKFADPPSVDVSPAGLTIGYSVQIPSIQVGAFALQNLALSAAATLPFNGDPFRVRFALSERQSPFLISVSLFTGGGFFALSLGLDGVECLEVSLEFGGSFSLDIGVASGGVYVMAGIYFKHEANKAALTGYVRAGGAVEVLGLITISIEFYLGLAYDNGSGKVWGEASMTVEIEVLFFSTDVTLTVRREFSGSAADPTLADTMTQDEWDNDYIAAFAA